MRILMTYDHAAMMNDALAQGWRIADVHREALKRNPTLSYDAVARLLRGATHVPAVAKAVAEALGKTEADYRKNQTPKEPGRKTARRRVN